MKSSAFSDILGLARGIESALNLTRGGPLSIHVESSSESGLAALAGMVEWKITQILE